MQNINYYCYYNIQSIQICIRRNTWYKVGKRQGITQTLSAQFEHVPDIVDCNVHLTVLCDVHENPVYLQCKENIMK